MLANKPPAAVDTLLRQEFEPAIAALAKYVSEAPLVESARIYDPVTEILSAVTDLKRVLRDRFLALLREEGTRTTDKGTLKLVRDGWEFEARPQRTGLDPKRVEAALRARGADPGAYMLKEISYSIDTEKLAAAIADNVLSKEELTSCKYEQDQQYAVQAPRRATHD